MEQFEAINVEQAYTRWKEGSAAPVDIRDPQSFEAGHTPRLSSHQRHPVGLYATKRLRAAGDGDVLPRQQQPQRGAVPAAPGFDAVYSIDGGFEARPVSIRKTWKPLPDPRRPPRIGGLPFILCAFSRVFRRSVCQRSGFRRYNRPSGSPTSKPRPKSFTYDGRAMVRVIAISNPRPALAFVDYMATGASGLSCATAARRRKSGWPTTATSNRCNTSCSSFWSIRSTAVIRPPAGRPAIPTPACTIRANPTCTPCAARPGR